MAITSANQLELLQTAEAVAREKMIERTGGARSVPEIFINDKLIGGNSDLQALEAQGKLDELLNG